MIKRKGLRRALGAVLVMAGGLLMWLAPGPTFGTQSGAGLALLMAGVVLELVGIKLEHRDKTRKT